MRDRERWGEMPAQLPYLFPYSNAFFCRNIVKWKDKSPIEITFSIQGSVI